MIIIFYMCWKKTLKLNIIFNLLVSKIKNMVNSLLYCYLYYFYWKEEYSFVFFYFFLILLFLSFLWFVVLNFNFSFHFFEKTSQYECGFEPFGFGWKIFNFLFIYIYNLYSLNSPSKYRFSYTNFNK